MVVKSIKPNDIRSAVGDRLRCHISFASLLAKKNELEKPVAVIVVAPHRVIENGEFPRFKYARSPLID